VAAIRVTARARHSPGGRSQFSTLRPGTREKLADIISYDNGVERQVQSAQTQVNMELVRNPVGAAR
jgi:hypothetical protein